jgi:TP901 family phage tail tape measure protein
MLFLLQAQMGSGYQSTFREGQRSISDMRREIRDLGDEGGNLSGSMIDAFSAIKGAIAASGVLVAVKEIYEAVAASTGAAIEFESAMTGVAKTSDMSEKELAAFAEEVKELATVIPVTTTELAGIAEVAGQLGIADENLLEFSEIMAKLGTATTMTADNAATMLAQFANITQMSPEKYENLASTIVDLGNNFATTEQKITDMAQGIAAAGSLAGMSEADMLGLSAAVTSLGIETQAGSSAMSKLIAEMSAAAEKGGQLDDLAAVIGKPIEEIQKALDNDKADKALKSFAKASGMRAEDFKKAWDNARDAEITLDTFAQTAGMSAEEFKKAWGSDAIGTLTKFITGLNDTERNGKSATLVLEDLGITEVRMLRMILSLSKSGDLMTRALTTANRAWEENTALQVEAEKRYATTESMITMTKNAWNNLGIAIGEKFMPTLEIFNEYSRTFAETLKEIIDPQKKLNQQLEEAEKAYEKTAGMTEASGAVALGYLKRLEELEEQGLDTTEAQEEYHDILEKLVVVMPDLRKQIDLETGSIQGGTKALREYTEAWMENAVAQAYQEQMVQKMKAYADTSALLSQSKSDLNIATAQYDTLVKASGAEALAQAIGTTVDALLTMSSADLLAYAPEMSEKGYSQDLINDFLEYSTDLLKAAEDVEKQQTAVDKYTQELEDARDEIDETAYAMSVLKSNINDLNAILAKYNPKPVYTHGEVSDLAWLPGFASGLDYVPYDNFGARLHKGERVLTAAEAREYRSGAGVSVQYSPTIYATSVEDLEAQLIAHANVIAEMVDDRLREHEAEAQRRSY